MKCPVCKSQQTHTNIEIHANGLDETLFECDICDSTWSENHGLVEIIKDTQANSFLEGNSEATDGADNS